jgi:single-stranded-DNA-specific exonuclease
MNITLPPITTPLASILSEKMLATHQAFSLLEPLMFDVSTIKVLKTIKEILDNAALNNQKVFVAGDYDADGICSTAMMVTLCRQLNIQVGYYIPHRSDEGYGLKPTIVKQALEKGYDVFICVDNGVSAIEALTLLNQAQKQVIIIDHHTITDDIKVDALLHPSNLDIEYTMMCTSGLVWLLASFLKLDSDFMIQCAGVATIADMMPLHRVNRYCVVKAIESMNLAIITPFALLLKKQTVNEEDLSFQLIPKINAIGRMSELANANTMVNYLCSNDLSAMVRYASSVEDINEQRKVLTKSMSSIALAQAQGDDHFKFIVSDEFHEGIVGLIANQIMRQVNTNVFVGVKKVDSIKGSMRSHNVHLVDLIKPYEHLLMHFGGHAKAAGLEISLEHFESFKAHILEDMKDHPPLMQVEESMLLDPSLITLESVVEFESLRPFGLGWEKPTIKLENVRIKSITPLKGGLSKATIFTSAQTIEVFAFDPAFASCVVNQCLDIEGTLGINTYLGSKSVQITLTAFNACQDYTN